MSIAALVRTVPGPGSRLFFGNFQIFSLQLTRIILTVSVPRSVVGCDPDLGEEM